MKEMLANAKKPPSLCPFGRKYLQRGHFWFSLLQATLRAKMRFIERDVDGVTSARNVTESGNIQKRQKERSLFCTIRVCCYPTL